MFLHSKVLTNGELVRILHNVETKIEDLRVSDTEKERTISTMQEKIERLEIGYVYTISSKKPKLYFQHMK